MTCNRPFPYTRIANFGRDLNPVLRTDPVGYSVYKDIDSYFDIGPLGRIYGPDAPQSQLYMADKCGKEWDSACEFISNNNNSTKCNSGKISSPLFSTASPSGMTVGDFLVENSAVRRFCDLSSCAVWEEPYNPLDPTSPNVKSYGCCGNKVCLPVCVPPENPDNDILLNKVLDKPHMHVDLLVNMYKNTKLNRQKYQNTRIGRIFEILDMYYKIHGKM